MNVKVVTDSGGSLTREEAAALGIDYLPLQVTIDETNYLDGINLTTDQLYDQIESGALPQTSMPPLGMAEDLFKTYKEEGCNDIVLITLSNGLSSTNQNLQALARMQDVNVHTLDLYTTLSIEWYAAVAAAQLRDAGMAPEQIIAILKEKTEASKGFLIPEDLAHLAKGGRLTPMAAKLGGLLKIKPILEVSKASEGKVGVWDKVRTMNKAIKKAAEHIAQQLDPDKEYIFFVLNSRNPEGAKVAREALKASIGENIQIIEQPICAVIASHTGLGAVGLQYIEKIEGVNV